MEYEEKSEVILEQRKIDKDQCIQRFSFESKIGLKQGCVFSSLLDEVVKKCKKS